MKKRLLAVLSCVLILLFCISALVACKGCEHEYENGVCTKCGETDPDYVAPCDHVYVDGVCTKCGETDPDYVAPKKDYDMSGVKFENKSVAYNGNNQTIAISGVLPQGVTVAYTYYSDDKYTDKVTEAVMPATYYVVASFKGAAEGYNPIADMKATLTIVKNDYNMSGVSLNNKLVQYTGVAQTLTVSGTLPQGVTVSYVYATDAAFNNVVTEAKEAGTYYVKASFTGQVGYHDIDDMTATLTISKLAFIGELSFDDKAVNYDGEAHVLEITGTIPNIATVSYKYYTDNTYEHEVDEMVDAGTYYVAAKIYETANETNSDTIYARLTINKIDVAAITFDNGTAEYDGEEHTIAITGELPQGVTAVEYKYYTDQACTHEVDKMVNAGTYYVKASFTVDGNHNDVQDRVVTLAITKKPVNVAFSNKAVDYSGEAQAIAVDEVPEEVTNVTYTYYSDAAYQTEVAAADVINAGTYYVLATFTTDDNHAAESKKATLTIKKVAFETFDESAVEFTVNGKYDQTDVPATITNGEYTFEYTPGRSYEITTTVTEASGFTPVVEYFRDGNLTDQISGLSKLTLADYGDNLYIRATYSDDNHIATFVKHVKLSKYTIELKTFEDLKMMRDHIYGNQDKGISPISTSNRRGIRYVLANDIDCEGQLWTPVTYVMEWIDSSTDLLKHTFCSEFDGNGHTISNYRITDECINVEDIPTTGEIKNTVYVGFFGRVNNGIMYGGTSLTKQELEEQACNIHDVTFSDVTIKFDSKDPNYTLGETTIVAGIVIGYTDTGNQHTFGRTNLYNITVKNCTIDIDAYDTYAGGIIGEENLAHNNAGLRYNLKVQDCAFYTISSHSESARVYVGGLVGRWLCNPSGTPDSLTGSMFGGPTYGTRYLNCSVTNIKLGYNYEEIAKFNDEVERLNAEWEQKVENLPEADFDEWEATVFKPAIEKINTVDRAPYLPKMGGNIYAGVFFGSAEPGAQLTQTDGYTWYAVNAIGFKNCSASNYLICQTSGDGWSAGFIGNWKSGVNMIVINSTHSNDANWNDGVNGVCGLPSNDFGDVGELDINEGRWKTLGAEWCPEITTEEEDFALRYLGLID